MKNNNYILSCVISQEQYSMWSWFLVQLYKMMIFPGLFFIFSFNFDFLGCYRGKRAKNSPKSKTSQEQYSLWSWFLVQLCKMIFPGLFFIFGAVKGRGEGGGCKREKYSPIIKTKITSVTCHCHRYSVKWWYLQALFSFFWNCRFSGILGHLA